MADQFTYAKLPSDPCLTQEQMTEYIDGKLSIEAQYVCEKHMLDCDLCSDAIEGLALVKDRAVLTNPLPTTILPVENAAKVVTLQTTSRYKVWYSAAAVLILVLCSTFFFKKMADDASPKTTAEQKVGYDSSIAPTGKNEWGATENTAAEPSGNATGVTEDKSVFKPSVKGNGVAREENVVSANEESPVVYSYDALDDASTLDGEAADVRADQNVQKEVLLENEKFAATPIVTEKKTSFWDKNKLGLPGVNPKSRAVEQQSNKQDLVVADDRKKDAEVKEEAKSEDEKVNSNAPAAPQSVVGGAVAEDNDLAGSNTQLDTVQFSGNSQGPHPLKATDKDLDLCYTNGMSQYNAGQYNTAIAFLDEVLTNKNHARFEDAEFQKANALIKLNRKTEAKTLLQSIELKKGKHAAEATELLKTL